jgi:HK97 family phage major capsid protein
VTIREILQRREAVRKEMRAIVDGHPDGSLPEDKATRFAALEAEATTLNAAETRQAVLDDLDRRAGGAPVTGTAEKPEVDYRTGLTREMRMVDAYAASTGTAAANLSAGKYITSMISGDWRDAEQEKRAGASEGVGSAGGFLLPSPVAPALVDLLRNRSVLINAGCVTFPMATRDLRVIQVVADPTAYSRGEGEEITESQGVFNALDLSAKSIGAVVRASRELVDDAPAFAAELDLQISKILALKIDALGLYGTGASNQPLGLRHTPGLQTISMGTNGALVSAGDGTGTGYDTLLQLINALQSANATAPTRVWAPRTEMEFALLRDGLGRYLGRSGQPDSVAAQNVLVSNQIPVNEVQGSASTASSIFMGDFANCCFGIRQEIRVEVSYEAAGSFKSNQVLVKATARVDFGVLRPYAMGMINGVL